MATQKAKKTSRTKATTAKKPAAKKPAAKKPAAKKPAAKRPAAKKPAAKKPAAKKPAAKKPAAKKPAAKKPAAKKPAIRRRDSVGHIDPKYAAELREKGHADRDGDDAAFMRRARSRDDLAEELGEEAVGAMTSGEDQGEDELDQVVDEEGGGPFVETSSEKEFAVGTDASNPKGATREPFPTT